MNEKIDESQVRAVQIESFFTDGYFVIAFATESAKSSWCDGYVSSSFEAYELSCCKCNEDCPLPHFQTKDGSSNAEWTHNVDEAEMLINGHIKWDGCSHYWFSDNGYVHFDGEDGLERLIGLIKFIYDFVDELLVKD